MLVDANLLIYATDEASTHHERARTRLTDPLNGDRRIGLPWQSLAAFLRITEAPLALEHGLVVCSADADFGRFEGVTWMNPLR